MAEYVVTVTAKARYVFDDLKQAHDLLDEMIEHCDNLEEVTHTIYESPIDERVLARNRERKHQDP